MCLLIGSSDPLVATPQEGTAAPPAPTAKADGGDVVDFTSKRFKTLVEKHQQDLDADFGPGFFRYFVDDGIMPRPYLVAAENKDSYDPETLEKEYAEILGYLYKQFFKEYGTLLGVEQIEDPVVVLVFDSKESYEALFKKRKELELADPEFMAGYFRPDNERLYQWRQPDLWHVMFHEGTHQLVHHATKKYHTSTFSLSPWFNEGIADYMGGHKRTTTHDKATNKFVIQFTLGQFIADRFGTLQNGIQGGYAFSLKELCYLNFFKFKEYQNEQSGNTGNQQKTSITYAQGWALVKFLHEFQDGKYRPLFEQYFLAECKGEGGGEKFGEIFGLETDQDWTDFEEEFNEWVYTDLRAQKPRK